MSCRCQCVPNWTSIAKWTSLSDISRLQHAQAFAGVLLERHLHTIVLQVRLVDQLMYAGPMQLLDMSELYSSELAVK